MPHYLFFVSDGEDRRLLTSDGPDVEAARQRAAARAVEEYGFRGEYAEALLVCVSDREVDSGVPA